MIDMKSSDAMQPLIFAILKALTPYDIETVFYDDSIEDIPLNEKTDLVAMSVETFSAKRAYQIADLYRKNSIPVVMGGFHPGLMPDEVLEHSDSVAIGDAEYVWPKIIEDFRNNRLKQKYFSEYNSPLLETNFDRSVFRNKKYFPVNLVQWGRGCPHNCDFCSIHACYGANQSLREIQEVVNEIKNLDNKPLFLVDDNLYHNRKKFEELLIALLPLKKKWACQISVEISKDDYIMDLMKKSGCMMVLLGIESFNKESLKQMNKSWSLGENDYVEAIKKFKKRGIMIYGTFVFGYDSDRKEDFKIALQFAIKNKFLTANFNPLYPMPGTGLYERLKSENRLTHEKWWIDPEFYYGKTKFFQKNMSTEELEKQCFSAKKKFNSYFSIIYRALDFKSNLGSWQNALIYILGNMTNRREIFKKQGKSLG